MRSKTISGYYIPQGQWSPTKRRGPIAAEFKTPSPAAICLPPTFGPNASDSRKSRSPSFSFGIKPEDKLDTYRPGPGEYEVNGVTKTGKDWSYAAFMSPKLKDPEPFITPPPGAYQVDGVTKLGKDWSYAAFMSPKLKDPEPFNTPPPGAYNIEKCMAAVKEQGPSYSFGEKRNEPKADETPAPCEYSIEKSLNQIYLQQPSYSIGMRLNELTTDKTPSPTAYNIPKVDFYKTRSDPSFTFRYKTILPEDKTRKPSPNDYNTERVWINKSSSPRYTFGIRHSDYVSTLI